MEKVLGGGKSEAQVRSRRKKAGEPGEGEGPTNDPSDLCSLPLVGPTGWGLPHPSPWMNLSPPKQEAVFKMLF